VFADNRTLMRESFTPSTCRLVNPCLRQSLTHPTCESQPAVAVQAGSVRGNGVFVGQLPTPADMPIQRRSGAPVTAPSKPKSRILLVDDEYQLIALLAGILDADYEIMFATNGAAALEIADRKVPDLIVLDVMMAGMDGYEVCTRLKNNIRTRQIPVIFITGLGDLGAETKGLKLGAVDYITKPFNPGPVMARVKTHINLKLAQDELIQLAATDGLTGLANRAYFDKLLTYEHARHARSGTELSLILLDIDHFKAFNDTYGHISGDGCLRDVAWAVSRVAGRATDIVARFGGEEFVLLLPETPLSGALILAEMVRQSISDLAIPHRLSSSRHVTASLGVASRKVLPGSSVLDIVAEADLQLYAAKAGGRNRVFSRAIEGVGSKQ